MKIKNIHKPPEVSIILPTYNAEKTIISTIESVFHQTYTDYELIVIDDGSTDKTRMVLQPYSDRIKYIYKKNGGPSSARNLGINESVGKYIAFIDSDDVWQENKLEKQIKYFREDNKNEVGLVFTDRSSFDVHGNLLKKEFDNGYSGHIFKYLLVTKK